LVQGINSELYGTMPGVGTLGSGATFKVTTARVLTGESPSVLYKGGFCNETVRIGLYITVKPVRIRQKHRAHAGSAVSDYSAA
jgi:hypothetical protein